ncbi:hypothetical protein ACT5AM_000993 [Cronobacter malonaticus]
MNTFARTRAMHQYYRDVFTHTIYLPESDALPAHIAIEILNYASADVGTLEEKLFAAETELAPEQDRALKLMMSAIALSNEAFDAHSGGKQVAMAPEKIELITSRVVEALQLSDNINYLVSSIQILFRINEIDSALFLISNNLAMLSETPCVLKILLLICLMEEDYNQAQVIIEQLTSNPDLVGEDAMTLVMVVCGIYKLGGYPDSFIDFRPLLECGYEKQDSRYNWLIEPENNGKTNVLVGCDKKYFFEHAIPLVLSIYETNHNELNVHLHIYNCDEEIERDVRALAAGLSDLSISLSTEYFNAQTSVNVHYACRRYVFLRHAMKKMNSPIMMLDADCLVRKSWAEVKRGLNQQKLIFTLHEGAPFWEDIAACFVYTEGGELANKYFDTVARFIETNLNKDNAVWFLDQIALSCAMDELSAIEKMAIAREEISKIIDIKHSDNAFSWIVTTCKDGNGDYHYYKKALREKYLAL